jgi:hypothetical protein
MAYETIPEELRRFILTSVASVPHLEAILLLRSRAGSPWYVPEVARRLYMPEKAAAELLADLHGSGMLARDDSTGSYRYEPPTEELGRTIEQLAEAYSKNLIGVTDLIHAKTGKKARIFADAFKWRKEP